MYRSGFTVVPQRPDAAYDDLLATLEQRLRDADARKVTNNGDELCFAGGFFRFVSNWNLLVPIGKGRISLDRQTSRITYSLSFVQLVIGGILMVGFMDTVVIGWKWPAEGICAASVVMFLWLVGMNYLIALARFDKFMKRCIRDAGFSVQRHKKEAVSS